MKRRLAALAFSLWLGLPGTPTLAADTPRAFVTGSYQKILAAHPDRPLLIAFWSLGCAHCLEELPQLGAWAKRHPRAMVVMVSTDTPEDVGAIGVTLRAHGLEPGESWVFADDLPERLRYEIDPRWRGELPRHVLREHDGSLRTILGKIETAELDRWLTGLPSAR